MFVLTASTRFLGVYTPPQQDFFGSRVPTRRLRGLDSSGHLVYLRTTDNNDKMVSSIFSKTLATELFRVGYMSVAAEWPTNFAETAYLDLGVTEHGINLANGGMNRESSHRQPSLASLDKKDRTTETSDLVDNKVAMRSSLGSSTKSQFYKYFTGEFWSEGPRDRITFRLSTFRIRSKFYEGREKASSTWSSSSAQCALQTPPTKASQSSLVIRSRSPVYLIYRLPQTAEDKLLRGKLSTDKAKPVELVRYSQAHVNDIGAGVLPTFLTLSRPT